MAYIIDAVEGFWIIAYIMKFFTLISFCDRLKRFHVRLDDGFLDKFLSHLVHKNHFGGFVCRSNTYVEVCQRSLAIWKLHKIYLRRK